MAEDEYFEAATLKSVADIKRHITSAKVELPPSLLVLVRVLNNYCCLLEVLFGPECHHLGHVNRDALETHEADLEACLTNTLIIHLMWWIHQDARQFFLACECWDDGESLPRSTLNLTVRHLVKDCTIQLTLTCPETAFLGPPAWTPRGRTSTGTRASRPTASSLQPTVNTGIPPLCQKQKVVATFNRLHPTLTIMDLCQKGNVRFAALRIGREGACVNFGLLRRCPGCAYRHEESVLCAGKPPGVHRQDHGKGHGDHESRRTHLTGYPSMHAGGRGPSPPPYGPPDALSPAEADRLELHWLTELGGHITIHMSHGFSVWDKLVKTDAVVRDRTVIGLDFSADWCQPCKQFTPLLKKLHAGTRAHCTDANKIIPPCRDAKATEHYLEYAMGCDATCQCHREAGVSAHGQVWCLMISA